MPSHFRLSCFYSIKIAFTFPLQAKKSQFSKMGLKERYLVACLVCFLVCSGAVRSTPNKSKHQGAGHQIEKADNAWIRINQLGYKPAAIKVAVWVSKSKRRIRDFRLVDAESGKVVFKGKAGKSYGAYGPFTDSYRLNFSAFNESGSYYLVSGDARSPVFKIGEDVYKGTADFALRYMRQQRSGFNPYLKDSCHTTDGYTMYGPMPDSTRIDVSGGWHDASDYLQYATTSANATYHLLAAYRDFPEVFGDKHLDNGLEGSNGRADVLDEARWGLDWLLKMHPREDWLFNQLADDRDHQKMRLPTQDSVDYGVGKAKGRPVYFATGEPQGLGKYKNRATGVASTAGKFASAFALASQIYKNEDQTLSGLFETKARSAYQLGLDKPGVSQTAPHLAPYFYEEDNWVDDMELGSASLFQLTGKQEYYKQSFNYSLQEQVTPWMGADTARHYQWYPFHNFGHFELAKQAAGAERGRLISFYKQGIEKVWNKGKDNAFLRGIPFIWCSNNLTTSFVIQNFLYRQLSNDDTYAEFEQANFDWLFGCNPWGTSMVFGLPSHGDTPEDPHSSFTYLYKYQLDGGLVDGPVYGRIYKNLIGITLYSPDEYAQFQSDLVVYHDDFGDYSTNEPTMDGTASLIYLLAAIEKGSLLGATVQAQQLSPDKIQVHRVVMERLSSNKARFNVLDIASAQEFSNFNFNNPSGIDTSNARIYNTPDWKSFLTAIDTARIEDYPLQGSGGALFKQKSREVRGTIAFSPVIVDSTNTLAVCITTIRQSNSGAQIAWYLRKDHNEWKIVEDQLLAMFD